MKTTYHNTTNHPDQKKLNTASMCCSLCPDASKQRMRTSIKEIAPDVEHDLN